MTDHEPARSERRRFMRRELWIVVILAVVLLVWLVLPKHTVSTQGGLVLSNPSTGTSAIVPVAPAPRPAGVP